MPSIVTYSLVPASYGPRYDLPEQQSLDTLYRETKPKQLGSGGEGEKKVHQSHQERCGGSEKYIYTDYRHTSRPPAEVCIWFFSPSCTRSYFSTPLFFVPLCATSLHFPLHLSISLSPEVPRATTVSDHVYKTLHTTQPPAFTPTPTLSAFSETQAPAFVLPVASFARLELEARIFPAHGHMHTTTSEEQSRLSSTALPARHFGWLRNHFTVISYKLHQL